MDESNATCGKRLESIGLENTVENRQAYRELLVSTPGLGQYISGAWLVAAHKPAGSLLCNAQLRFISAGYASAFAYHVCPVPGTLCALCPMLQCCCCPC